MREGYFVYLILRKWEFSKEYVQTIKRLLHCIFYFILHITFFKSANDGFVTLQLATEFLKQLPGTLEKPEFSTNGNYLRKMHIDLAKSISADTGKTGTAPQGVRENDSIPNICAHLKVSRSH